MKIFEALKVGIEQIVVFHMTFNSSLFQSRQRSLKLVQYQNTDVLTR
jgi:hypothetical protein